MPPRPDDPLQRELDAALEGVNLQDLDDSGHMPRERARPGAPRLLKGTIVGVSGDDVFVELGPRMQGVIPAKEFDEPPAVGQRFEFSLHGQEEGLWLLSRREAKVLAAWDRLDVGARVEARVTGQNSGGLELSVGPLAAFMPASQVALHRVDHLASLVGQVLVCEVLELDRGSRRVLLSRRAVLEAERDEARAQAIGMLEPGQVVSGKVSRLEPFGAFVDLGGGLEGLLHVSNLARRRVENPAELLKVGQPVRVMVLELKEGGRRIGLGMKQLEPDPWDEAPHRFTEGQVLEGRVTRIADFGAFVELVPGVEGLLHVSQLGRERVRRPGDVLSVGQELPVRVLSVDPAQRRISLSRLDERGAVLGSEDAAEGPVVDEVIERTSANRAATNLGSLMREALERREGKGGKR
jgi:ribosomal protein S1